MPLLLCVTRSNSRVTQSSRGGSPRESILLLPWVVRRGCPRELAFRPVPPSVAVQRAVGDPPIRRLRQPDAVGLVLEDVAAAHLRRSLLVDDEPAVAVLQQHAVA